MKTLNRSWSSWIAAAALLGLALAGCDASRTTEPSSSSLAPAQGLGLAETLADPDPYARAQALGTLLPTLGPEAIPEVRRALEQHRLDLGGVELELLLRFWASHDPAAATRWTFKKASPVYRPALARTAVEIFAEADPPAAVGAVRRALSESDVDVARLVELGLVQGWFKTDRAGLEDYIYGLGSGTKRQRAVFVYLLELAAADGSDAAIRWAEAVPEDDRRYKLEVYRQLMSALAWADMPAAQRFCDAHCEGPYAKGLRNVLVRTRLRDGEYGGDVVEWVARASKAGDERQLANKRQTLWIAYATWAYRNRKAAIDWMQKKLAETPEPEPWLRQLYGEYARQIARDAPEEAIRWAERMDEGQERQLTLVRIARYWLTQDEEAAEAWLSQSSLPEEARQQARDTKLPHHLPGVPEKRRKS